MSLVVEKRCPKCSKIKSIDEFFRSKAKEDGYSGWCKECDLELTNKYYKENKKKLLAQRKSYYQIHREEKKKKSREYWWKNREERLEYAKLYQKMHKAELGIKRNIRRVNKYGSDVRFNLIERIRKGLLCSLKKGEKKNKSLEALLGYSVEKLKKHLEKTIPVGYSWDDYLVGKFHIDYIIPISAFNFSKPEHIDFKRCWSLKNLRLLPAEQNLKKGNKLEEPFQPFLALNLGR